MLRILGYTIVVLTFVWNILILNNKSQMDTQAWQNKVLEINL